ncbi:MAG: hypothetical protein ABW211_04615, partial [Acidimicrobiia bacterium]
MEISPEEHAEVICVARGIATAVAPDDGITEVQALLLSAIALALTGVDVDYHHLEPLSPDELADVLKDRPLAYRQRIVHHMVLGELVLKPLPTEVAHRVAQYSKALGVDDHFVRVARRYAQGAYGMAWMDLRRSGFVEHVKDVDTNLVHSGIQLNDPFLSPGPDPDLEARWIAFRELPEGTLGRAVIDMYDGRGFGVPGSAQGASPYLAQHDFAHVLADYGTTLKGELEVFAFVGRADPDPKGFAWLATVIGLFDTGYVADTGFFTRDISERNLHSEGMQPRLADAIARGKAVSEHHGIDLFEVDFHALADRPVDEVRVHLSIPPKSAAALAGGSPGVFERAGMTATQQQYADGL